MDSAELYKVFEHRGSSRSKRAYKLQIVVPRKASADYRNSFEFVALDSRELSVWRSDGSRAIRKQNKNVHGMHVLRSVCYHVAAGVHLLASIDKDMSIMVLSGSLDLIGTVPMGQHIVQDLAYMCQTEEVLTGGSMGLRAFRLCGQPSRNGRTKRWILQLTRLYTCPPWVSSLRYHEHTNTAVVIWPQAQCVDLFDTAHSKRVARLAGALHDRQISDAVFFPRSYYFITSCLGGNIKIWYREQEQCDPQNMVDGDLSVSHLHTFTGHRRGVTRLDLHPTHVALFLSVSLDGSLRIWNAESLILVNIFETPNGRPLVELAVLNNGELIVTAADDGTVIGYAQTCDRVYSPHASLDPDTILDIKEVPVGSETGECVDFCFKVEGLLNGLYKRSCVSKLHQVCDGFAAGNTDPACDVNESRGLLLKFPETCQHEHSLLEILIDSRSKHHNSKGHSPRCIAAVFVHNLLDYCIRRLNVLPKKKNACNSIMVPQLRLPQQNICLKLNSTLGETKRCLPEILTGSGQGNSNVFSKISQVNLASQPARLAISGDCCHFKFSLAPYAFLRKAMCRHKSWKTAPLCR